MLKILLSVTSILINGKHLHNLRNYYVTEVNIDGCFDAFLLFSNAYSLFGKFGNGENN